MPLKQRRLSRYRGSAEAGDVDLASPADEDADAAGAGFEGGAALIPEAKSLRARWRGKFRARFLPSRSAGTELPAPSAAVPATRPASPGPAKAGGRFEVRLADRPEDIAAAQALRYRVFYQEMQASPSPDMVASGRDFDAFDGFCDHLLVIDHEREPDDKVVGTYRLLRQAVAERHGGFYSASEYDLTPLQRLGVNSLLELGRSCVHADYRTNATIQLLWRGIASYMIGHGTSHMFGCASFAGVDPSGHAEPLSYLHHHHRAPPELAVRALPERYRRMDLIAPDQVSLRSAMRAMPPLIKAYLRLGAYIGEGAVVDDQFGTTDVFILLPVARIAEKYYTHFDRIDGTYLAS